MKTNLCFILQVDIKMFGKISDFSITLWDMEISGEFNTFSDFFVQAFKIVIDSWKFCMLLTNFHDSKFTWTATPY